MARREVQPPDHLSPCAREHVEVAKSFKGEFTTEEFRQRYATMFPTRAEGSMLPSDYCINADNKGNLSHPRFLKKIGRATYRLAAASGKRSVSSHPVSRMASAQRVLGASETPNLSLAISRAFARGELDLTRRDKAPLRVSWNPLPECEVANQLRSAGADDVEVRLFLTFVCALDRARDAARLWHAAAKTWHQERWVFDPAAVTEHSHLQLLDALRPQGVSQRHSVDGAAWRTIAESLTQPKSCPKIHEAVFSGKGTVSTLRTELQERSPAGTKLWPMLSGPKVGPMWIRMLAVPGAATIDGLDDLDVAVDVQVAKVTHYLGLVRTLDRSVEKIRASVQAAWKAQVATHGAEGPDSVRDTPAALDPALWFFGKWG